MNTNIFKKNFAKGIFLLVAVIVGVPMGDCHASTITPDKVLELVNADRVAIGLPALTLNNQLTQAAEAKAKNMAEAGYFAHTSPTGKTPWDFIDAAGYSYHYAGENLAIRFVSAEDEHAAWMASPTHRANILSNKYLETGIAVWSTEQDGRQVLIAVEEFGTQPGVAIPTPVADTLALKEQATTVAGTIGITPVPVPVATSGWAKMMRKISMWSMEQILIVVGLGIAEVVAVTNMLHILRKKPVNKRYRKTFP
ncbi:MAG: CAP domain-containing protein [Candidatus Moraniibacteriota bacterium]